MTYKTNLKGKKLKYNLYIKRQCTRRSCIGKMQDNPLDVEMEGNPIEETQDAEICTVCREAMMGGELELPCDHKFHPNCIHE